jgi:hypothetical protein
VARVTNRLDAACAFSLRPLSSHAKKRETFRPAATSNSEAVPGVFPPAWNTRAQCSSNAAEHAPSSAAFGPSALNSG